MSFCVNFPLFCVVACLLCAVISSVLKDKAARLVSMGLTLAVLLCNLFLLLFILQKGSAVTYLMGHYPHPWGNELHISILEPLFCFAFSCVMLLCLLGGRKHIKDDLREEKRNLYYVMADLVLPSLLVLSYTNDIFTGYVFIEICTLSSCGLLMIRQIGRTTLASVRYMIFSLLGSGLFLLGVVVAYSLTGQLLMPSLKASIASIYASGEYRTPLMAAICLITVGLCIKSGLFPFHFWMPDTYGCATPASSGILSGLVSKGYIFFLLKIIFDVFGTEVFYASGMQNVLYAFGACGIVVGSVSALRENDISRMIAYSSAAQIGYIYLGIGISGNLGVIAALYHILTHAMTKPALFLAAARLSDTAGGARRFKDLQGAGWANRTAGAFFTFEAFSMIGLPLTMGFISKYLFALAAFRTGVRMILTLVVLAVSTVLNTLYFARTVIRLYNKQETELRPCPMKKQASYAFAALLLAGVNVGCGVFVRPLLHLLSKGVDLF